LRSARISRTKGRTMLRLVYRVLLEVAKIVER
jgi:hypothetical protein